ncbi:hypothetical protein Q6670_004112 [Salmonella enterica]|nr:hypothetical protein [Salmonella enterica]
MKKTVISIALAAIGLTSMAASADADVRKPTSIKECKVYSYNGSEYVPSPFTALVADWGDKFAFRYVDHGVPMAGGLESPPLTKDQDGDLTGRWETPHGKTAGLSNKDYYAILSTSMAVNDIIRHCKPAAKALVAKSAFANLITTTNVK